MTELPLLFVKEPYDEQYPLVKKAWLPELDEEEEQEEEEKELDDVYHFNLQKEMDAIRWYFWMGYLYGGPIYTNVGLNWFQIFIGKMGGILG